MKKLKRNLNINKGLYLNPAELYQRAVSVKRNLICCHGRIQALEIAKTIYKDLKNIQDKPTEFEKKLIAEEKIKRQALLTKQFKKLQGQLKKTKE